MARGLKHLTAIDAMFLYVETPEMPMHVSSLMCCTLPDGYQGDYFEDVKALLQARLHLASLFTSKLVQMPFDLTTPVWVEDENLDLDYHVRRMVLSKPGTREQLHALVARLQSSLLDRSRPLWEIYVIEGLENGEVAVFNKIHHAAMDGQGGVAVAKIILDITPEPRAVRAPRTRLYRCNDQLGAAEMMSAGLGNTAGQVKKVATVFGQLLAMGGDKVIKNMSWKALLKSAKAVGVGTAEPSTPPPRERQRFAPTTVFNGSITNQRSVTSFSLDLAELKALGKSVDATINDMVMAICSGALRSYLSDANALPAKSMIGAVPYSMRAEGNTEISNQSSLGYMRLRTDIADPMRRLRAIQESSQAFKQDNAVFKGFALTDFPSIGLPWLLPMMVNFVTRARLTEKAPALANVAISNVPGPNMPLYFAGARLRVFAPVSIVMHGVALNITVQSYNGGLNFGVVACRRALPNMEDFAEDMLAAYEDLKKAIARHHRKLAKEADELASDALHNKVPSAATDEKAEPARAPIKRSKPVLVKVLPKPKAKKST